MNAAGNDGEWRKEGMNSIRTEVRNVLKEKIDSAFAFRIMKYVKDNQLESWTCYAPYALINNGPPNFDLEIDFEKPDIDLNIVNKLEGLREYFLEFYKNYDIENLWEKYHDVLQAENQKYEPYANGALSDITSYCRLSNDYYSKNTEKIFYQTIPLISYFTAQTIKVNGAIYIITGPTDGEPSEASFYHEALHHPIGEIIKKYSSLVNNHSEINKLNKADLGYPEWVEFFEECLVRTIDCRMSAKLFKKNKDEHLKRIYSEYEIGMILCPYLNEELEKYESANITFEKYFPAILENLDYNRERMRIDEFNNTSRVVH